MKPIAILGAGLSGLACAATLFRAGKKVVVIEKREKVGGRVSTERSPEGFLFDEGFQVLLSSYPELPRFVDLKSLRLQAFNSGALIFNGKKLELLANPFRHPQEILSTLKFSGATLKDKALVAKLMFTVLATHPQDQWAGSKTLEYLKDFGFSEKFIESFWKPFLGGVYLDPSLSVDSGFFKFLMNCFAWGEVTLPENGMAAFPEAISRILPRECFKLNQEVKEFSANEVRLKSGEVIECSQVVCAFDEGAKKEIYRSATTDYFTSSEDSFSEWNKWLVLIPPKYGFHISHLALISSVAKQYSPGSAPLLSVTRVGNSHCEVKDLIQELEQLSGKKLPLKHLCTKEIPLALPVIERGAKGFEMRDGVLYCGDRFVSPSINGALKSGRVAAESLV